MNISSLIIHARPEKSAAVAQALGSIPGVEIHTGDGRGRFVVTIEDTPERFAADIYTQIHNVEGVLSAAVVYQYSDDDEEARQ